MKRLSDYKGEEAIIISGKIMKPMGEILDDKEAISNLQEGQFDAIGDIMQKHSKAVADVITTVSGGEYDGSNASVYFMTIFTEYCQSFGDSDFFKSSATVE